MFIFNVERRRQTSNEKKKNSFQFSFVFESFFIGLHSQLYHLAGINFACPSHQRKMLQTCLAINCGYRKTFFQYCATFLRKNQKQQLIAATRQFSYKNNFAFNLRTNQPFKSHVQNANTQRSININGVMNTGAGKSPSTTTTTTHGYLILRRSYCMGKSSSTSAVKEVGKQLLTVRKQQFRSSKELRRLFSLAKNEKWYLIGAIGCLVISSSVAMGVPYAIGKILDMIVTDNFPKEKLQGFCFILFAVFVAGSLANFGRIYLMNNASKYLYSTYRGEIQFPLA